MVYRCEPWGEAEAISTLGNSFAARSVMLRISRGQDIMVDFKGASGAVEIRGR